ncbi:MAG: diguanylate cyclase [Candidatus Obscuribacterales bacterium]|nr:diguanylate cyclase [Candidatus Obscuribacterales bacterium]
MKIRSRLLLVCFAVSVPLLCICALIIWKEYQGLYQAAKTTVSFQDSIAVRSLSQWVATELFELKALSHVPDMQNPSAPENKRLLENTARTQRDWNAIIQVDTNAKVLNSSLPVSDATQSELKSLDFFRSLLKSKKPAVSGYVSCPVTGHHAILFGVPLLKDGRVQSVLIASVNPSAIIRLFSGLGEDHGSVIAVIDSNKKVLARTIDPERWVGKDFSHAHSVQHAQKVARGVFDAIGIADHTRRTYAFDRVAETNWIVVAGIPSEAIYGSAHDRLLVMLGSALIAIGVSMAIAYRVTGHFTGPINELVREAVSIGRGDLSKRAAIKQGGELGLLARAFNQMAINLELNRDYKQMVEKIADSIRQSLDLDQILNTTVTELGQALSASRCCLALFGSAGQSENLVGSELEFNYVWWDPEKAGTALNHCSVLITENSMLKLILEQKAILSLDVMDTQALTPLFEKDENSPEDWRAIKSLIACPIVFADQAVGMILVQQCDVRRAWFDLELELVEAVANHVALAMEHANLFTKTKTLAEQEFLINNIVRSIRASLDTDTILNTVTGELGKALGVDYCQIAMPRAEGPLVVTHEWHSLDLPDSIGLNLYDSRLDFEPGTESILDLNNLLGIDLGILKDFASGSAAGEIPISAIADVHLDSRTYAFKEFLSKLSSRSLIAAPLLQNERLLGILIMQQCRNPREWHSGEIRLAGAIADQLAVAISHAELFAQVKHQAITDGLTGLYNHVYFKNRLSEELKRAHRKGTPCSLLMLDLDKLKQINDTMGHPIGDAAIRQVAMVLKNLLRSGDTAARYGGEEFAVILPETPLSEALLIAERLRQNINRNPVPGLGNISTSIGASFYPVHAESPSELIDKADKALYVAKRGGRNRVCVWSDPQPLHVSEVEDVSIIPIVQQV